MSDATSELVRRARALPRAERERLIDELLASLNEPALTELDAAWKSEIEQRLAAYDCGAVTAVDMDGVLDRARAEAR